MISKKIFTGGINADDTDMLVAPNEYLNAVNVRFATTDNGKIGEITNVDGTTQRAYTLNSSGERIPWTLPAGTNQTICALEDTPNRRVFFFNKNSNGNNGVYCYYGDSDLVLTIMLASNVVGGMAFYDRLHSAAAVGDMLYWTDGQNPQRRVNVMSGIKLYHPTYGSGVAYVLDKNSTGGAGTTHLSPNVITLIRNQPWAPLSIAKAFQSGYTNNFISKEAFQFAYRFVYKDGEVSTFSPLSGLSNYNTTTDTANKIVVTIPTAQVIEQDVVRIEVAARFVVGGKYSIVKTFKDKTAFTAHNAGTALTFDFFNDAIGIPVDDASAFKQYDAIPRFSGTLEIAKNRLFLGDNFDGYDTPATTSLNASFVTGGGTAVTGNWEKITYNTQYGGIGDSNIIYIGNIGSQSGYYYNGTYSSTVPLPTTVDFNLLTFLGASIDAIPGSNVLPIVSIISVEFLFITATVTNPPAASSLVNDTAFKSDSSYRLGIVFYDEAGRKCGVVTNESLKKNTADRTYSNVAYEIGLNWALSNTNAVNEIPDWARYYSIVMTKSLRTSFFMQLKADDVKWVTKTNDGTYNVESSYSALHYGLAIEVKSLYSIGYGYSFQEGDLIKLYPSTGTPFVANIKDTYGSYIICDNHDLTGKSVIYEIYTPYMQNINEPYYERGAMYKVSNPGNSNRSYSVISGTIEGDITIMQRGAAPTYLTEAMSPMDLNWKLWNTDAGRANIVTDAKGAYKRVSVYFSNVIVPGSQTNGLSTFDVLDQVQLPIELRSIRKLFLVNKVEAEGTVMLAIGEQETASMYLGESQVIDNTGASFLAKSSGVIGNVNVLRGSFGTFHPESVSRYSGQVFWFDVNKGVVVSYASNGLFPISQNKMSRYFRRSAQTIANSVMKRVPGGVDPYYNEVLVGMPMISVKPIGSRLNDMYISTETKELVATQAQAVSIVFEIEDGQEYVVSKPAGVTATYNNETVTDTFVGIQGITNVVFTTTGALSDSVSLTKIFRSYYDIQDNQGCVWAYQPGIDHWSSQYTFQPDCMSMVNNRLKKKKNGIPYTHDNAVLNTFYGNTYDSTLVFVHNEAGNIIKGYYTFSVEGDVPDVVHVRTEVPYLQSSDIRKSDFVIKEGVSYSSIYRDRLTPGMSGLVEERLKMGQDMRGEVARFQLMYTKPTIKKVLKFCNIGFTPSRGHTTTPENS